MHALKIWRENYFDYSVRPASPVSEDEGAKSGPEDDTPTFGRRMVRYNSEPPEPLHTAKQPPTSRSWVRWWRRNDSARAAEQVKIPHIIQDNELMICA